MEGYAKQKVPGGKLLAVRVHYSSEIKRVQITGDFFMYPEEKITEIEESLANAPANESEMKLAIRVKKAVKKNRVELVGITPEAIANTVKMAMTR